VGSFFNGIKQTEERKFRKEWFENRMVKDGK
jgi:hypothetical protein